MAKTQHREDYKRYQQLLEATRDEDGVENRDAARKALAEELAAKADRLAEFAEARATEVADGFDESHKPEIDNGQMAFDIDAYLTIGKAERVRVDRAKAQHTRQWLDIQAANHARVAASWAAKDMHGRKLLKIQDERKCTMWEAEQILRGGAS